MRITFAMACILYSGFSANHKSNDFYWDAVVVLHNDNHCSPLAKGHSVDEIYEWIKGMFKYHEWFHLEIEMAFDGTGKYSMNITDRLGAEQKFTDLICRDRAAFAQLSNLFFISSGKRKSAFYIDNFKLELLKMSK
ncbi:MAG: hypothetical protein HQL32_17830 [Planctomycetes bacterium]|nr:hypothetical protein [Planctomycetota bacterium]